MRAILLALLVLGTVAVIAPAPASAHEVSCVWGDWTCWTKCQVGHYTDYLNQPHSCRWIIGPLP
jgi:hypothetical protein